MPDQKRNCLVHKRGERFMLTIGLSAVLIVTLIILFACISENINLKMEVEELKRQNEIQRFKYSSIYRELSLIHI